MNTQHFERAVQDVNNMEKHFTSAINHLTKAINEKDDEYKSIKEENEILHKREQQLKELLGLMVFLYLFLYIRGFVSGWYVCS